MEQENALPSELATSLQEIDMLNRHVLKPVFESEHLQRAIESLPVSESVSIGELWAAGQMFVKRCAALDLNAGGQHGRTA